MRCTAFRDVGLFRDKSHDSEMHQVYFIYLLVSPARAKNLLNIKGSACLTNAWGRTIDCRG